MRYIVGVFMDSRLEEYIITKTIPFLYGIYSNAPYSSASVITKCLAKATECSASITYAKLSSPFLKEYNPIFDKAIPTVTTDLKDFINHNNIKEVFVADQELYDSILNWTLGYYV